MKRIATLALAFVLAIGVALPSLAYTNNASLEAGESPFTVDCYLVEYQSDDLFTGITTVVPANRGYAKNEIVAAIGTLTVPAGEDVYGRGYVFLAFEQKQVNLNTLENYGAKPRVYYPHPIAPVPPIDPGKNGETIFFYLRHTVPEDINPFAVWTMLASTQDFILVSLGPASEASQYTGHIPVNEEQACTYRFLVFGKITGSDASIKFSLMPQNNFDLLRPIAPTAPWRTAPPYSATDYAYVYLILNEDYVVVRSWEDDFYIYENTDMILVPSATFTSPPGRLLYKIETNANGVSERLTMYTDDATGPAYRIFPEPSTDKLVFVTVGNTVPGRRAGDQIHYGTTRYDWLYTLYKSTFEEGLGLSAFNEGNLLRSQDWGDMVRALRDVSATANIEPWTPYISVPENIVTNLH